MRGVKQTVNLYEQLLVVKGRLEGIGAHDDSMDLVEKLLDKAQPGREDKNSINQVQVLRHMIRMPETIDNYNIYNDLQELISERDEVEVAAHEDAAPAAYVDTERRPKPSLSIKRRKTGTKKRKIRRRASHALLAGWPFNLFARCLRSAELQLLLQCMKLIIDILLCRQLL